MQAWRAAIHGQSGVNGYIQSLAVDPFQVTLFLDTQLSIFVRAAKSREGCVVHLDSTGTVVRNIPNQKRPFLYSVILAGDNIPILEFISTDHRAFSIAEKLERFLADARRCNQGRPALPRVVVTDFSFALINAVLSACNKMTVITYLKAAFELLSRVTVAKTGSKINFTIIALCKAHMLKAIANR
jgi:hypothetical protein